jgi:chromate transporter
MPTLAQIGIIFARYANLTLGGGSATAATMHRELVEKRRWLTDEQFTLCFALGRITPGTNLLAFCTGFGWMLRGASGAIVALLASSIPCAVLVAVLTALFSYWQDSPFAQAAIHGEHPGQKRPSTEFRGRAAWWTEPTLVTLTSERFGESIGHYENGDTW